MKEISKMRLGVLRELKNVRLLLDKMEGKIKGRDQKSIEEGYMFLKMLVILLDDALSPDSIALNLELERALQGDEIDE